jgi:leader peptidase (prepilin peptidase) / N-methyltransferase
VIHIYDLAQGSALVLGLLIGSFLNVCIARMPEDRSIVRPASHCPACGSGIRPWDNIPVLSWLLLRAKCRDCGTGISVLYPIIELMTGLVFWLVFRRMVPDVLAFSAGHFVAAGLLMAFSAMLIALSFIDLRHYIIPDEFSIYAAPLGILGFWAVAELGVHPVVGASGWQDASVGAFLGSGFLLSIMGLYWLVRRQEGMGMGDVKLLAMMGAFLGAAPAVPFILVVASMMGAVVGVALVLFGGRGLKTAVPFGPFLALAAMIYVLHGPELVRAHLPGFALIFGL